MEYLQARSGLVNFEYLIGFQDGQGHDAISTPGQLWFWPRASRPPFPSPRAFEDCPSLGSLLSSSRTLRMSLVLFSGVSPDIGTVPNWRYIQRATLSPSSAEFFRYPRCHNRRTEFPCHRLCLVPDRQPVTRPHAPAAGDFTSCNPPLICCSDLLGSSSLGLDQLELHDIAHNTAQGRLCHGHDNSSP